VEYSERIHVSWEWKSSITKNDIAL
jgi:hypothetical protein